MSYDKPRLYSYYLKIILDYDYDNVEKKLKF